MSELISRQDAIETVGDWMVKEFGYLDLNRGERLIDAFEALPSAEPKTGWIPVSERLPEEHGVYLVTFPMTLKDTMSVTILMYGKPLMPNTEIKKVCWYDSDSEYGDIVYDDVVAWMPMPKPYKGGDAE